MISEVNTQQLEARPTEPPSKWNLFLDGSACGKACGTGIILTRPGGPNVEYALKFNFKVSNNMVEYDALITRLLLAID